MVLAINNQVDTLKGTISIVHKLAEVVFAKQETSN